MTKKDYEAIAKEFREQHGRSDPEAMLADLIWGMADLMESDNPRFDRSRFLAACRGEDSTDSAGRTVRYAPCQPKTGERCGCKRGIERDNCPACEGTGQKIDFRAIRAANGV